jgi:hypothetical protein
MGGSVGCISTTVRLRRLADVRNDLFKSSAIEIATIGFFVASTRQPNGIGDQRDMEGGLTQSDESARRVLDRLPYISVYDYLRIFLTMLTRSRDCYEDVR